MNVGMVSILVSYFIILLFIGTWASKKIKTAESFIVAGKELGFWVFTVLVVASCTSGMTLIGVAGLGFKLGWPTIWEQIFVPLACAISIWIFGTKLYRVGKKKGYLTVQDYFAHRFYSPKAMRGISGFAVLVTSLIYLVGQYTAVSIVLSWIFGISHLQALMIAAIVVMVYVLLGGLYAVSWTSLFQGLILILGVLFTAPFVIVKAGGMSHVNNVLSKISLPFAPAGSMTKLAFPSGAPAFTPAFLVSFFFLLAFGLASAPHIVNNVLAAKRSGYFKWAPLVAFLIYLPIMYLIKFVGFSVRAMVTEGVLTLPNVKNAADYSYIAGVQYALPNVIWAFFAVVVLAAVMSTTDRLMLTIGSCAGWDIYKNLINPSASDSKITTVSRAVVIVAAIGTVLLAINPPKLLAWLIWMGIGLMLATFVVPLLAGLYWRRATREGAISSMLGGFISAVGAGYYDKFVSHLPVHFSFYGFIVSIVLMVVISLLTQPPDSKLLDETETGPFISSRKME